MDGDANKDHDKKSGEKIDGVRTEFPECFQRMRQRPTGSRREKNLK